MPVASRAAALTRCPRSHSASASRPLGKALKVRVRTSASAAGRATRTVAVICILCTSSPAARAWMTWSVSVCTMGLPPVGGWIGVEAGTFGQPTHNPEGCGAFCCTSTVEPGTVRGTKPSVGTVCERARGTGKKASTRPLPPSIIHRRTRRDNPPRPDPTSITSPAG